MDGGSRWGQTTDHGREEPSTSVRGEGAETSVLQEPIGVAMTLIWGTGTRQIYYLDAEGGIIGRGDGVDVRLTDPTVSREHARITFEHGGAYVEDLGSANQTFLNGRIVERVTRLPDACRLRFGPQTAVQAILVDESGARSVRGIIRQMFTDTLTRTGNRRSLARRLREEVNHAIRYDEPLGFLLADLDHFKRINDDHGHPVGDRVLTEVGRVLKEVIRDEGSVYRYGGEEFCVLLRGATEARLTVLGERMREAVETLVLPATEAPIRITTSIGIARLVPAEIGGMSTLAPGSGGNHAGYGSLLVEQADRALRQAKSAGRNRVVMSTR